MQFFEYRKIKIKVLSDLLNVKIYEKLGALLETYFSEILFRNRELDITGMESEQKELLSKGNDKDYWARPEKHLFLTGYEAKKKALNREEKKYRELNQMSWIPWLQGKLAEKWSEITICDQALLSDITEYLEGHNCPEFQNICPVFTGVICPEFTKVECPEFTEVDISHNTRIYPLSLSEIRDKQKSIEKAEETNGIARKKDVRTEISSQGKATSEKIIQEINQWLELKAFEKKDLLSIKDYLFRWDDDQSQEVNQSSKTYEGPFDKYQLSFNVQLNHRPNKRALFHIYKSYT